MRKFGYSCNLFFVDCKVLLLLCALCLLFGCASKSTKSIETAQFEDYDEEETIADPLEPWNRVWFRFNDFLMLKIAKPVYTGYTYITPKEMRSGLSNFLHNVQMPVRFVNSLLQGKVPQAIGELGKFIVNSTAGFGGVFNITERNKARVPMDPEHASFGYTLATWGVGEGIYLVWPVLGPSTIRNTIGMAGDYFASPFYWCIKPRGSVERWTAAGVQVGLKFNDLGSQISAYEELTKSAVEPYSAVRDAYVKINQPKK